MDRILVRGNNFQQICTPEEIQNAQILNVIPNHLALIVIDPGHGLHPQSGDFVRYKQVSYLGHPIRFLKEQTLEVPYQRRKLIPALEIIMAFAKENSRFRVWTSSVLAYADTFHPNIPMGSSLLFDIHVFSVSKIPIQLSSNQQTLMMIMEEVLAQSNEGDQHLKKANFQESLKSYENAVNLLLKSNVKQQIASLYQTTSIQMHEKQIKSSSVNSNNSADQQRIILKFQNVCFKYLELGFSVGEYLKVTTMAPKLGKFLSNDFHPRILHVLILTYLQLEEVQLAENNLKALKSTKQAGKQLIEKLQRQLQKTQESEQPLNVD